MKRGIIDVNVYLSRWPARRLPYDEAPALVERLREAGVEQAWVGSFDALLHRDLAAVNERLAEQCREFGEGMLLPFGAVNPRLPDWREDLRRCQQQHGMTGIRIHPNYHDYRLDSDEFADLLDAAVELEMIVQLPLKMEDERTQHPLLRAPPVDAGPLEKLLASRPQARVVLLNSLRSLRGPDLERLAGRGRAYFELSMLEGVGGVADLLDYLPLERILFGSYFPFFYWRSAALKLQESELGQFQRDAITNGNAQRLVSPLR